MGSNDEDVSEDDAKKIRGFISSGSEATGAAVGGAIGLVLGPIGAVAGAAGGVAVAKTLETGALELYDRVLTKNQQRRSADAFVVAAKSIDKNLIEGRVPRDDGFFDRQNGYESSAAEILEGALLKASNTYEQKKVAYLGEFFSSLVFRPDVSEGQAIFLLEILDRLTYGQIVMLAIFGSSVDLRRRSLIERLKNDEPKAPSRDLELADLAQLALIGYRQEDGNAVPPQNTWGFDPYNINTTKLRLTPAGSLLYELLKLEEMPESEMGLVIKSL